MLFSYVMEQTESGSLTICDAKNFLPFKSPLDFSVRAIGKRRVRLRLAQVVLQRPVAALNMGDTGIIGWWGGAAAS